MAGVILLGVFVVLLICGAPIAVCLGMSSVAAMLVQGAGKPIVAVMSVLPRICSASSSKFVLLAIPFFIISGNVMEKAGISGRLINLAEKCLGHIKGGMAMVCIVVSCFFAAISGSGPATVAALGLIMIPALVKAGYPAAFSCALMAAGGAIGVVIPPSITFVVYGSIADASITSLFKAGMVPGLLMGAGLIITALVIGRKCDLKVSPKASGAERLAAFMGDQVDLLAVNYMNIKDYVENGDFIVLGVCSEERCPGMEEFSTLKEQGYDIVSSKNYEIKLPKGADPAIVNKLSEAIKEVTEDPDFKETLEKYYAVPYYRDAAQMNEEDKAEVAKLTEFFAGQ